MKFRTMKRGMRVLGIAESFTKGSMFSKLAGIVMRRDLIIDGMIFGNVTIEGDDATQSILSMYRSLKRNDINCIMLDGIVISMYNIIDGKELEENTKIPVIVVTFEESEGLEGAIRHHFSNSSEAEIKIKRYHKIGQRDKIRLWTGKNLFIRYWGISSEDAYIIINFFTLQGSVPEPIRIAKLAARASIRRQ